MQNTFFGTKCLKSSNCHQSASTNGSLFTLAYNSATKRPRPDLYITPKHFAKHLSHSYPPGGDFFYFIFILSQDAILPFSDITGGKNLSVPIQTRPLRKSHVSSKPSHEAHRGQEPISCFFSVRQLDVQVHTLDMTLVCK